MVNDGNGSADGDERVTNDGRAGGLSETVGRRPFLKTAGAGAVLGSTAGCLGIFEGGGSGGRKIGVLAPTSGSSQEIGQNMVNAASLALEEIGEVNGEEVELVSKDSTSEINSKYEDLYLTEEVDATVGLFSSENLNEVANSLGTSETIHLTTGAASHVPAMNVDTDYENYKYFFRTGPTNVTFLSDSMMDFATARLGDLGWESVGILVEDRDWTQLIQPYIAAFLQEYPGVSLDYNERLPTDSDWGTVYSQIENQGVDGVLTAFAHSGAGPIQAYGTNQPDFGFGGINVPAQMFSTYRGLSEAVSDEPSAAEYIFTQTAATKQAPVTEKTQDFAEAYEEANDSPPIYTGYHAYDAVYVWKEAVEEAGTFDTDEVISALEGIEMTGVAGTISFYGPDDTFTIQTSEGEQTVTFRHDIRQGENGLPGVYFQWQDGQQEVIYPDDLQSAEYETPSWI